MSPADPRLEELAPLLRRLKMPHVRRVVSEVCATARAQRWDPAELPRPCHSLISGPMLFWSLALIGGVLMFFEGYKAASADAEVCTYMGSTDELIGCDSGPATMLLSLGVIAFAAWRLYANWKKPPSVR